MPKFVEFKNAPSTETPLNDVNLLKIQKYALENCYPVGSVYITLNNEKPNITFGFGTWEKIKGKFLIGVDETDSDFNTVEKTGGEKEHRHDYKFALREYFGAMGDDDFKNVGAYKYSESRYAGKTATGASEDVGLNTSFANAKGTRQAGYAETQRRYRAWKFFTTLYHLLYMEKNSIGEE